MRKKSGPPAFGEEPASDRVAVPQVRMRVGTHHAGLFQLQRGGQPEADGYVIQAVETPVNGCLHCGGELKCQVETKEKVHPYRVICLKCGVGSAWHGDAGTAWRAVSARAKLQPSWCCFHCGDTFYTEHSAKQHFGYSEEAKPACLIAAEGGLLEQYRRVEDELAALRWSVLQEDTEAAKAHYGHMACHASALRQAEEIGYTKGLADGRALAAGAPPG